MIKLIRSVEIIVEAGVHPLETKYSEEIAANWKRQTALNANLYNGEFYLTVNACVTNGVLSGASRRTDFATFMYWLTHPTDIEGVYHVFSVAAMIGNDNKIIMGKMASHTANAGRIYMPSGSISDEDINDNRIDFDVCMIREVREETGVDLSLAQASQDFMLIEKKGVMALIREFYLQASSIELLAEIENSLPLLQEKELENVYAFGPGEQEDTMPKYLQEYQMYRLTQEAPK